MQRQRRPQQIPRKQRTRGLNLRPPLPISAESSERLPLKPRNRPRARRQKPPITIPKKIAIAKAGKKPVELSVEEQAAAALEAEAGADLGGDDNAAAAGNELELDEEDNATRTSFSPDQQKRFDNAIWKKRTKITDLQTQLVERDQALEQLVAAPAVAAVPT